MKKETVMSLMLAMVMSLQISACSGNNPSNGNTDYPNSGQNGGDKPNSKEVVSDVVGKVVTGYQGWFATPMDGSPAARWWHWGDVHNPTFEMWPDMREYPVTYQTGYANLGNGGPAVLYSNYDQETENLHFKWMKEYGIDCAAIQRFGAEFKDITFKRHRDAILEKVKSAAELNGVKFYVMYDMSGWDDFQVAIKKDWTESIVRDLQITSSSAYARHDGKPVVAIWGFGIGGNPGNNESYAEVIKWFKDQGCFTIVGGDDKWRTSDHKDAFLTADMISPWTVGGYKWNSEIDSYYQNTITNDLIACREKGVEYQPVIFPGFSWYNLKHKESPQNYIPRNHGDFLWYQFANVRKLGMKNVYIAMFDEYDEGTAIAKIAENKSMAPTDQWFLTLDADGIEVSSDFYLRLVKDGGKMIKGEIGLTWTHPTSHK